ncbi:hypothetical protein EV653_4642 [Kribbella pratensis]|uniref:TIR domain-containing protein n=1 Tax=Kribbella pratensis TaxID=2512112 RepID=A0A4R8C434_9ACTN|nr:hypothetical protein EV653_4642 [Kribbella pratensis]
MVFGGAREALRKSAKLDSYDIFLSHSFRDAEIILGVKKILERSGRTVYVDWIEDAQLDRSSVTAETADLLRRRMKQSLSLVYAYSESSTTSKWMPWELGYFDGYRSGQSIGIMPLVSGPGVKPAGQEYLGLYPRVEELKSESGRLLPYVVRGPGDGTQWKSLEDLGRATSSFKRLANGR